MKMPKFMIGLTTALRPIPVLAQSAAISANASMTTGSVVSLFLPDPKWQSLSGSLEALGISSPFTIIAYCPPGAPSTECGFPSGDGGTFTAAPSSFFATGLASQLFYTIDCTKPEPTVATCTSIVHGPFSTGSDGLINISQTSFAGDTTVETLTGTQVTSYPFTITAGPTQLLEPKSATSTAVTTTRSATPSTTSTANSADIATPKAIAALVGIAFLAAFQ